MSTEQDKAALAAIPLCQHCRVVQDFARWNDKRSPEEAKTYRCVHCWEAAKTQMGDAR
jgi:hypothetical protein